MIYMFELLATEERQVESEIKIRAKNENETRELCQKLLRTGLEKGIIWKCPSGGGCISDKSKHVGKCVQVDIDVEEYKKW